jgi:outer membrane protein assembly factor BamE (lipoprotein component of BamABCDE complex)
MYLLKLLFITTLSFCLCACFHPDIDQGNNYTLEDIQSLKIGMQKNDVIELLGNPVFTSPFDSNELIYIYYNYPNRGKTTKHHVSLVFKKDILVAIHDESTQAKN